MKKILMSALVLLLGANQAGAFATDATDPVAIIKDTTSHILEMLESRREEFIENPELLRNIVRADLMPLIDLNYSARLILGKSGRGATPEQLNSFSEAMSSVLDYVFKDLDFHRLEADTDPNNLASLALLEKLGFRREGYFRERWFVHEKWHDSVMLGLLRSEWNGGIGNVGMVELET